MLPSIMDRGLYRDHSRGLNNKINPYKRNGSKKNLARPIVNILETIKKCKLRLIHHRNKKAPTIEIYKILNLHSLDIFTKYLSPCHIHITLAEITNYNGEE